MSRKQLPLVDANGSVKYSTPSGDIETYWLGKGSGTPSPQSTSLSNYYNKEIRSNSAVVSFPKISSSENCKISTSEHFLPNGDQNCYWKSNLRNDFLEVKQQNSSAENNSDGSQDSSRV